MSSDAGDDLLAPMVPQIEKIEVGGKVAYVRKLTVDEQLQFEDECGSLDENDKKGWMAISLAFYVCKQDGTQRYTLGDARSKIGAADKAFIQAVLKKGQELNQGIAPDAVEAASKN